MKLGRAPTTEIIFIGPGSFVHLRLPLASDTAAGVFTTVNLTERFENRRTDGGSF
jgi:hypothetical protein